MKLSNLIGKIKTLEVIGNTSIEIDSIAYDSRKVSNNSLFVCIKGAKTDGHLFIENAIKNGAVALIVEDDIDEIPNVCIIKVKNARSALADVAVAFYKNATDSMDVIGVTGTNGKTTITHIIKSILESNGVPSGLIGTISYKILDKEYKSSNTTPESLELQKLFSEMKSSGVNTCAMEVSSHSLEMGRVRGVKFKIGVFTNLTPDHMDFHLNVENYRKAKTKLFYQVNLANIINIDDKYGKLILEEIKDLATPVITYGIDDKASIHAKDIKITPKGSNFTVVTPKFSGNIFFSTPGRFSVYNVLAAVAVCTTLGYDFDQIKKGVESIKGVPGRFELVQDVGDYTIIVDYAHTPDALENVLNTIKGFANGKIITVFGCGGDRDKTKRPIMGELAGSLSDFSIITSDNPRTENPEDIMKEIEVGIKSKTNKYKMIIERKEAIKEAVKIAGSHDIILIAGKGHETYQIIGEKISDFDDKKIARKIIQEDIK